MKVEIILNDIEKKDLVLPEFQRGFVWNDKDIKTYIQSLYRDYPTGSLLIWKTTKPFYAEDFRQIFYCLQGSR